MTPPRKTPHDITSAPALNSDSESACHMDHGYISNKSRYVTRLKRVEGQTRGIQRLVEERQNCIDILTQIGELTKALESVALGLLGDHLKHCLTAAAAEGGSVADAKRKEASDAIARLVRS